MDIQAINTDYGVIPSEQEFDFETSFDFSSIMMIGSTSNAKRCMNDNGTICQVKEMQLGQQIFKINLLSMKTMVQIQCAQTTVLLKIVPVLECCQHVTP